MKLESVTSLKESLRGITPDSVRNMDAFALFKSSSSPAPQAPFGVALGIAPGTGRADYRLAIRLTRIDATSKNYMDMVSVIAKGEVDVQVVGDIHAVRPLPSSSLAPLLRQRNRPLIPGCSLGHYNITAGTLGGFVKLSDGSTKILSNNHVLADSDAGRIGDRILQSGPIDGGAIEDDVVAKLHEYAPLRSHIDAALATMEDNITFENHYDQQRLVGVDEISLEAEVSKLGRTTGLTKGKITAVGVDDVPVRYGRTVVYFDNQVEVESEDGPFSQGGDSGALIFNKDLNAVALLFAGTTTGGAFNMGVTYANPLTEVLKYFGAQLLT